MARRLKRLFITFEGCEGSGKTTQARLLARRLEARRRRVVITHEPAGTQAGRAIWDLIAQGGLEPLTELLLFVADRAQHVSQIIRPALEQGRVVICDRFSDSTVAYQGYGRGLDVDTIVRLNAEATGDLKPHLTVLLDVPVGVGLARQGRATDVIGNEGREFHERVRRGYRRLAGAEPDRWLVLDAKQSQDGIAAQVWQAVEKLA